MSRSKLRGSASRVTCRRLPGVSVLLALVLLAALPAAASASGESLELGHKIHERLMAVDDPTIAMAALTAGEERAYREFIRSRYTTSSQSLRAVAARDVPGLNTSELSTQAAQCWVWTWQEDNHGGWGYVTWSYFQELYWCDNGSYITTTEMRRWGEVYTPGWQFTGHTELYQSGGRYYTSWNSYTQGEFAACTPGCFAWKYPWLDMTAGVGGTGSGSVGGGN